VSHRALGLDANGPLQGTVRNRVYQGNFYLADIQLNSTTTLRLHLDNCPPANHPVQLSIANHALHAWDSKGNTLALQLELPSPSPRTPSVNLEFA